MCSDLIVNIATAFGTIGSAIAAVYYGSIRPARQVAQFEISEFRKTDFHSIQAVELVGEEGDMLEIGFFVKQISGAPSTQVSILVKKVLHSVVGGNESHELQHFIPSVLKWAAKEPVSFSTGTLRYCYLGSYGDPPGNEFVGEVFTLSTDENTGDPHWGSHSNLLPINKGKLLVELLLSGENVKPKEFIVELELYGPNQIGPLGDDGLPTRVSIKNSVRVSLVAHK